MPGIERKKSKVLKQLVLEKYIWLSNGRIILQPNKQININDLVDVYATFKALKGKPHHGYVRGNLLTF